MRLICIFSLTAAFIAQPLAARDSLGVFGQWGAFADPQVPRCYAIAIAEEPARDEQRVRQPFANIGTWPRSQMRGQVHLRLSRDAKPGAPVNLVIGGRRFALASSSADAWAADARMDAGITSAMRSAASMSVSATAPDGRRFTDRYRLQGAANAMDAATLGCARFR